jgi:hypothetical protein
MTTVYESSVADGICGDCHTTDDYNKVVSVTLLMTTVKDSSEADGI